MTLISCPCCAGPVELSAENLSCLIGHEFDPPDLSAQLSRATHRALWSAVRALEDSAASARWRLTQPDPAANGEAIAERAERSVKLIRGLLEEFEGDEIESEHRPRHW